MAAASFRIYTLDPQADGTHIVIVPSLGRGPLMDLAKRGFPTASPRILESLVALAFTQFAHERPTEVASWRGGVAFSPDPAALIARTRSRLVSLFTHPATSAYSPLQEAA